MTWTLVAMIGLGLGADGRYDVDGPLDRPTLEAYLARSITMEGMLHGRGDLEDNLRMLRATGAKLIGRAACTWANEQGLLANLEQIRAAAARAHEVDPEFMLQACIFEIVTTQVDQVPVPSWAQEALGQPVEARNFRYADMLYPDGQLVDHWNRGASVPDISRPETQLYFTFLGASFIDAGCEALHLGQVELMNRNDRDLAHYFALADRLRAYGRTHARRGVVLLDSHVPSGGLVREGRLLLDFHSFPLRIVEVADRPEQGVLEVGHYDSLYGRSKGGLTAAGWSCESLPYLVEIDNWGRSQAPGAPGLGGAWIWGYDEISWYGRQAPEYRHAWLRYAWDWIRVNDPNGWLQMPGSRTMATPAGEDRWYYANRPSEATPRGFGDEDAIGAIWAAD